MSSDKPTLAVFKFASCDGCQLSVLSLEDELLAIADNVEIAFFLEATSRQIGGPYDVGLVEGSISTAHDAERILRVREQCRRLVTIGACATAGGIQALRNWARVDEYARYVYAEPQYIEALDRSTPISDHVPVDFELRGCPVDKGQLLELISCLLRGAAPRLPSYSVCMECKRRGTVCVAVARGVPCLGPATQAGCGALCPSCARECFGCFGPQERPNLTALAEHYESQGADPHDLVRLIRGFAGYAPPFRDASDALEQARPGHGSA